MIPPQNQGFVVAQTRMDRINDLVEAMAQAGIIPASLPADRPYLKHAHKIDRLDIEFRIAARVLFDVPTISAINAEMPNPLLRLALRIRLGEAIVETYELSTGQRLAQFRLALSGRLAVSGFAGVDGRNPAAFFALQSFEFFLDDYTLDTPLLLPAADLSLLLSRVGRREIRAKLIPSGGLPEKRFPISPSIEEKIGISTPNLGLAFREPVPEADPFEQKVCLLPSGQGWPTCQIGTAPTRPFYQALDVFAGLPATTGSVPVPINRLGRHFQIDAGADVLRAVIAKHNSNPKFHGDKESSFFKATWGFSMSLVPWASGSDDAGIRVAGSISAYSIGFKIKMCEKEISIFGRKKKIHYPCGFEKTWWKLKDIHASVTLRPKVNATMLCVERGHLDVDQDTTIWGYIVEFIIIPAVAGTILGLFGLAGVGVTLGVFLAIVIEMLDEIVEFLGNAIIPNEACTNIQKMLRVPIVEDRVNLIATRPALEFKMSGMALALDGDFTKA